MQDITDLLTRSNALTAEATRIYMLAQDAFARRDLAEHAQLTAMHDGIMETHQRLIANIDKASVPTMLECPQCGTRRIVVRDTT